MKKLFSVSTFLLRSLKKSNCQNNTLRIFSSVSTGSRISDSLFKRISPLSVNNPSVSITPVLDQWVRDGNSVDKPMLVGFINGLKNRKRFTHALEVSEWMTDKRYMPLNSLDVAMRISLIFKVHGLEQVENYFSNIPQGVKSFTVQLALLNCYAHAKCVDKAEAVMQRAKDMGYFTTQIWYNVMMDLYYNVGDLEKLNSLVNEMEAKGIHPDRYTLSMRLKAYTSVSDADGIENVVNFMESDPLITLDWNLYSVAATGYLKVGSTEKALQMLRKMELMVETGKRRDLAMVILLQLYAKTGRKDELYRVWKNYKEKRKVYNNVYRSMISSLMKLGDFDGVESVFTEWKSSSRLSYDFRIVNYVIDVNCRKGNLEKAEALLNRGTSLGVSPNILTWCILAGGYIMENESTKAIDSLKKAILISSRFVPTRLKTLESCLKYLEEGNDMDEFVRSLNPRCFPSTEVHDKLVRFIETGEFPSHSGSAAEEDDAIEDETMS